MTETTTTKPRPNPWRRRFYHDPERRRVITDELTDGRKTTLRQAFAVWVGEPGVRLGFVALTIAIVARVWVGDYSWWDLLVVGILVGIHPLTEWVIHTTILHAKPAGKKNYSTLLAREHVRHHKDPKELETIFIPLPTVISLVTLPWLLLLIPNGQPVVLSGLVAAYTIMLAYEWSHYLIHTPYQPKGKYYKKIHRAHRLHHFRNENYWFGVTNNAADHVLGTYPAKEDVPRSQTATDLWNEG